MIVDDDRTMNSLLKTLLELEGFQVVLAPHGDMVLATALAEKPDAVLMDVYIADANGMDLLSKFAFIRSWPSCRSSCPRGWTWSTSAGSLGRTHLSLKPYPPDELSSTLKKVIL